MPCFMEIIIYGRIGSICTRTFTLTLGEVSAISGAISGDSISGAISGASGGGIRGPQ